MGGLDDALCDDVTRHDAPEDVDQNGLHLLVTRDQLKRFLHLHNTTQNTFTLGKGGFKGVLGFFYCRYFTGALVRVRPCVEKIRQHGEKILKPPLTSDKLTLNSLALL